MTPKNYNSGPKPQHANAHVVTRLSQSDGIEHAPGPWHEPHGCLQSVAFFDESLPGVVQHARLGASGLQLLRGPHVVCIPLQALFDLAAEIEPQFAAPPDKKLTPKEVESLSDAPIGNRQSASGNL
ncbi:MAG: hypothetical protein ABSE16_08445 [Verrucomicrobiota bacterium]|jgi:hypothetical protein